MLDDDGSRHNVEVRRELKGWAPTLTIIVDGLVVHSNQADEKDMNAFNELYNTALDEKMAAREKEVDGIRNAASVFFED